ncbi:MAG: adenylate/guanylate cyclase domain-containing protein [Anaerolineae bacterium]
MSGETILVIDDSKATRDFVVDYVLKPNGYIPLIAGDGEEGLRIALTALPDLIILDLEMPKLSGLDVLKALKKRAVTIPVILSTAHGSEALAIEVFRHGVRDYVVKPFEIADMLNSIERALAETRTKRERDDLLARLVQANRSLEARLRELSTLYGISKSVTALIDHDSLLRRIVEAAQFVTGAQSCLLRLRDPHTTQVRVQAVIGTREQQQQLASEQLAQQVLRTGMPAITPHATAVPLKVGHKLIGALDINNDPSSRPFLDHDMHLLQALADYAAIAIENSRLFRELEESKERETQMIRNVFERYVTPAVVEQLLSQPENIVLGGARRTITTLFADLRGFTAMSSQLKPEVLFEALNHHLSLGAEAVLNHEGTLDKFMGDAIMAFFNAPLPQPDYALRAVKAAVEMQRRIARQSRQMPQDLRLQFGIGVATGDAIVGNIGTAQLMNYTAIGNSVNLARRLQESAKGGQVLIDQTTYEAVAEAVKTRSLGTLDVKGLSAPVRVYEILGLK